MDVLPTQGPMLVAVAFLLGMRHGLDPDHLAAIDGLVRHNAQRRPALSRWSGLLFSAGHGAVVTAICILVATVAGEWHVPPWLDDVGAWISIGFLAALGAANLLAVVRTPAAQPVRPVGIRARLFARLIARLTAADHPVLIAAVGAAFAISFDTISQAVLFSVTGSSVAGVLFALALGAVFTAGMMVTDAASGWWVSAMLARCAARRAIASRVMGTAIGTMALAIAALGVLRQVSPEFQVHTEGLAVALGLCVLGIMAAAFSLAWWLSARAAGAESGQA